MLTFLYTLGDNSYYPPGAPKLAENRLFGMYHSGTADHNKDVIIKSMTDPNGVVRVVFATVALGMDVHLAALRTVIHYGAPRSLDNYFQECGRAGRSGEQAFSVIYWCPRDARRFEDTRDHHRREEALVREYLENVNTCRRLQLMQYFIGKEIKHYNIPQLCCDVCNARK